MSWREWFDRIPDSAFFAGACALFLAVALALGALAGIFSGSIWSLGDTRIFLRMAELIVQGGTPYVDFKDPKPPLIFFLLAVPTALGAGMAGGLLLVAVANFASAVLMLAIGWRLYGRIAGLFAGLAFAISVTWAQGYFVLTEPFTLTFILLSVYFLLSGRSHRYLAAGACAGLAIGFKQYALLLVPLTLFFAWRKGEGKAFPAYMGGVLLALIAVFSVVFLCYGVEAGLASLYWSFGMASSYLTDGSVQDVTLYQIGSPTVSVAWIVLSLSFFFPLVLLAIASFLRWKPGREGELFALAAVLFAGTLLIRPFLHYWAFVLPFVVLLVARAFGKPGSPAGPPLLRRPAVIALVSGAIPAALLFGSALAASVLINGAWRPRLILELYGLADIVLKATARYFGHIPEPVAVQLHGGISTATGSLLLVAGISLISALVVSGISWRMYGRGAALLAGALFAAGTAFALGYMLPTDALAVLLVVASLYVLLSGIRGRYLAAGLLTGTAIVLKPLAIVLLFGALFLLWRERKLSAAPGLIACALAPISFFCVAVSGSPFLGVSWDALPQATASMIYDVPDALMAMLNLAAAGAFVTVTSLVALASYLSRKASAVEEYLLLSLLLLLSALFFRELTHYWFVALPFAALLCARLFSDDRKVIMGNSQ